MTPPTGSIRGRTRWLIVTPLLVLALLVVGVVALEGTAPTVQPIERAVEDLPPLAVEDERSCLRLVDDQVAQEIRENFEPGGRVSSTQVNLCPAAFDGAEVTFVGEVIGDLLPRRGGAWVQVNDDAYALEFGPLIDHRERSGFNQGLSVWLPDGLHDQLGELGGPDGRGDVIAVRGRLWRADPDDGGGTTIRAEQLELLAPSLAITAPLHRVQAVVAAVLAVLAVATLVWSRRRARR